MIYEPTKGEFYTFLWKCIINRHRSLTAVENNWTEALELLTWLSQNWRDLIWLKPYGYGGIRETGLQSFLFRNRGKVTSWWERYKKETETCFLHEELFLGWDGPCVAQQAKESWKGIRKKLFFTLSITNCLKEWKHLYSSTWMLHLSSALTKTTTGLNKELLTLLAAHCHMDCTLLPKYCNV